MMFSADPIWGREKSCSILGINCTNWCMSALSSPSPPAAKTISDVLIDNLRWTSCFWWSQIGRWESCREQRWLRPRCGASSGVWQDTLHLLVPERMMAAVTSLCGALWAFRERSVDGCIIRIIITSACVLIGWFVCRITVKLLYGFQENCRMALE